MVYADATRWHHIAIDHHRYRLQEERDGLCIIDYPNDIGSDHRLSSILLRFGMHGVKLPYRTLQCTAASVVEVASLVVSSLCYCHCIVDYYSVAMAS
jgi:hypothetical protein